MIGKTELLRRALGLLAALAAVVGREELKESRSVTMRTDVGWGLVDATAIPGKLFEYSLPRTTLEGQPTKYTVFETGSDRLPKWLSFDSRRNILEGVPSLGDRDRPYFMEVSAENIFGGKNETVSKDVFVIDVRNEVTVSSARPLGDLHGNATIVCAPGDAVTMATVTMDADFDAMSGSTRAKLIRDFGRHVGLSVTSLRMRSSGGHDNDDGDDHQHHRLDNIPLVAGPGNVASQENSHGRTLLLQWVVGCGSVVTRENVPILEHLEATAVNGSLAEDTGSGIIGWHVTTTTSSRTPRRKRLVPPPLPLHHPTATPLQTRRPPFGQPTATRVVFPTDGGPETRVFPTPVAPGASVTSDRPHRSKSRQRHPGKTKHGKQTRMPYSRGDESDPDYFKNNRRPTPGDVSSVLSTTRVVQVTGYPGVPDAPKHPDYLEPSLPFPVASVATVPTRPLASSTKLPTTRKMKMSDGGRPWDNPVQGEALPTADDDDNNLPPLWKFTVSVGEVFAYAFPSDTFHRHEDLELVLITPDDPSRSWIKVDSDARKLYGLPLERDAGGGVVRCALVGRNSRGEEKKLYDVEAAIRRRLNSGPGNHEVRVDLDAVYDRFAGDVDRRIDVATRIAHAHGDRDAAHVRVARIREGSVEFFWTNRSLADEDPCPVDALRRIADRMIRTDGLLDPDFTRAMGPHEVRSVTFTPKGTSCISQMTARIGNRKEDVEEQEVKEEKEPGSDPGLATSVDGLLITTIVPILILVVVIIFILIVVCVVCSRRRKKNRNKNNTEEEKVKVAGGGSWGAASRKGVPVIFADELEEKSTGPSRALTVTSSSSADERRPMIAAIPPDYDHPTGGHSPSSPPLVPGRDQDVTARRRNSPPAYNNGANHPTTTTTTAASTPHHRRVASGGSRVSS